MPVGRPRRRGPCDRIAALLRAALPAAFVVVAMPVRAQLAEGVAAQRPRPEEATASGAPRPVTIPVATQRREQAPWWAPLMSAIAPGAGQAALGQDRWLAFAALEGAAWMRYRTDVQEARRERRRYRRIANEVARALYSTGMPPVGGFEYYETMEKWIESGVYDAVPGGPLDPEADPATFNGSIWLLARQTYWSDPDEPPLPESVAYRDALAFYERRAIRPEYRWSWRDAQLEQDLYRRAIARSNSAFRSSAQDVAAVIANHVLSTVDAYVTVRLRRRAAIGGDETRIEASMPWPRRLPH